MNKFYSLVTAPTEEPIDTLDAVAFLRADASESQYIEALVSVAREIVENFTGRALMAQTWKLTADRWRDCADARSPLADSVRARTIKLERSPLASVSHVKYWPAVGSTQLTLDASYYITQTGVEPGRIVLKYDQDWPDLADRPDAVEITFVAGYASAAAVPASLRHAVSLTVSHLYDQRAPLNIGNIVNEIPFSLRHLLESQRVGNWSA